MGYSLGKDKTLMESGEWRTKHSMADLFTMANPVFIIYHPAAGEKTPCRGVLLCCCSLKAEMFK